MENTDLENADLENADLVSHKTPPKHVNIWNLHKMQPKHVEG